MTERGAVFVSIDDHEVTRLRLLLDDVFGEDCFVAQIVVNLNPKGRQLGGGFATSHEYLLVYARSMTRLRARPVEPVDRRPARLPAHRGRRTPLPAPPAAQHQQEVQPGHRADHALRDLRVARDRPRRDRAVRRRDRDQAGLRRRLARRLALVGGPDRRAARRPGLPLGRGSARAGAPTSSRRTGCTRAAARSCARSGSPPRSARPTPRSPSSRRWSATSSSRPSRPGCCSGSSRRCPTTRACSTPSPAAVRRATRSRSRTRRTVAGVPVCRSTPPSRSAPAPTPTWPATPASATSRGRGCGRSRTWSAAGSRRRAVADREFLTRSRKRARIERCRPPTYRSSCAVPGCG